MKYLVLMRTAVRSGGFGKWILHREFETEAEATKLQARIQENFHPEQGQVTVVPVPDPVVTPNVES